VPHRGRERSYMPHRVHVEPSSKLAHILDATDVSPASSHHQAVRDVAPGLQVVARADDGVIEALEMREHPWLVAVQWHPEYTAADDATQQRLFDALVEAARKHRRRATG
jgi:putative glutamine amidotransferase